MRPPLRPCLLALAAAPALLAAAPADPQTTAPYQPKTPPLTTPWTALVSPTNALPEYPRPQMVRPLWQNLNGVWQFAADTSNGAKPPFGTALPGSILVPFPEESALSGVMAHSRYAWYRRTFTVPAAWQGQRVLLNFGAANWRAAVYVNGAGVGAHQGGYGSFSFDITPQLNGGANELIVGVYSPVDEDGEGEPIGKQRVSPSGIWYTASSGLWQTVWLEPVPNSHLTRLDLVPDIDAGVLRVTPQAAGGQPGQTVRVVASSNGVAVGSATGAAGSAISVPVPGAHLWSPDDPFLYDLTVTLLDGAGTVDQVASYFGMRKISLGTVNGVVRPLLNNRFVFQVGPLDQGYWPDGVYTAPTDAALAFDLREEKRLGYNTVRKHAKVEPARFYYWTDKLGLFVWQDMPQMFPASLPPTAAQAAEFEAELREMVTQLGSAPSIIQWTVFNESWGEYDAARITGLVQGWDPSRLADNASGWNDAGAGSVVDMHNYVGPGSPAPTATRAACLGEFGGLGYFPPGHQWDPAHSFSYETEATPARLTSRYAGLIYDAQSLMNSAGLSACIYTAQTDVENELDGNWSYDRQAFKFTDAAPVAAAHASLIAASRAVGTPSGGSACWRFDEGAGAPAATDATGNGNAATLVNGPAAAPGVSGAALGFDGVSQFAQANRSVVDTGADFSVSAWVQATSTAGWETAVSQDGVNVSGFFLQNDPLDHRWAFSMLSGDATNAGATRALSADAPVAGTWYHLLGVHDAAHGVIKLYVNGALAGTQPFTTHWNAKGNTVMGRGRYGAAADFFPGQLDDVRVFNHAATPFEAAWLYRYPGGPLPLGGATGVTGGDGVSNLLKYALNIDPRLPAPTAGSLPAAARQVNPADGRTYLTFSYRRLLAPGSLTYTPEVSHDLRTWSATAANYEELTPAPANPDGLTQTVTVRVKPALDAGGPSRTFARLRVSMP